ncbi:hypothetical protein ACEPPN_006805 [Leptodophora sp. 'Broadleaf-Isolate-01']
MALTRLMARANKRQTRSMTMAEVNTKSSLRPITASRRPPARKQRVRAVAARRASNATPKPISTPALGPVPSLTPAQDDHEDAGRASSLVVPAPADQPLSSSPSPPALEQEQEQQFALEIASATIEQASSLLQHVQPRTSSPVLEQTTQQQFSSASLPASPPTPSSSVNTEQLSAPDPDLPSQSVSFDFLNPRPEPGILNPKADWYQEYQAAGTLSTARMVGKFPHKRVIPDNVGPDPSLFNDDSSDDDPNSAPKIKPKPYVTMTFREIEAEPKESSTRPLQPLAQLHL